MASLQKLLGKEDRFFELFEASAQAARNSVRAFTRFVQNPKETCTLDEFVAVRREEKAINRQISELLCTTFVSAMDREDVEALATALYKIPKTVEKIAERVQLAPHLLQGVDLSRQVTMLEAATDSLLTMVKELRTGLAVPRVRQLNEMLQAVEGEADKTVLDLLRGLYTGNQDAARVVYLKDLFELLEKVTDRCRDAGNIIVQIVLKGT
jgi:uncharacterized protein Yka (UPF0111/DUF47 family)